MIYKINDDNMFVTKRQGRETCRSICKLYSETWSQMGKVSNNGKQVYRGQDARVVQ